MKQSLRTTHPLSIAALLAVLLTACILSVGGCRNQASGADAGVAPVPRAAAIPDLEKPAPPPTRKFTIVAVGDIMLDRNVGKAIRNNGYQSILAKVRDLTRSADIAFANLECPLAKSGAHSPGDCIFRADPETIKVVLDGGFDIVSLANNHTLDAGAEALRNTLDVLEENSIAYCGARREKDKAWEPTYLTADGYTIGFMAYTHLPSYVQGSWADVDEREVLAGQLATARQNCDLLFVSVHWGQEYKTEPETENVELAHFLVDNGADVVFGHHPHVLQGIEVYKNCPIFYSAGNFVFDQKDGERMESAMFSLTYSENYGWSIFAKPIYIPRSRMGPIFPEQERAEKIAGRLADLSQKLGTEVSVKHNKIWLNVLRPEPGEAAAATGDTAQPASTSPAQEPPTDDLTPADAAPAREIGQ